MATSRVIRFEGQLLCRETRGVNLANRHARLLSPNDRSTSAASDSTSHSTARYPTSQPLPRRLLYFQGIQIPQVPIPPSTQDCCMSNCQPCVHDIYLDALKQYKHDITNTRNTLEERRIPIQTWPSEIRPQISISRVSDELETNSVGLRGPASLDNELQYSTEMKAIKAAEEAKSIMTRQVEAGGAVGGNGNSMLVEAGRLAFWVLRGCPE